MLPRNIPPPSQGGPKTFALDATLPKLPLPSLSQTLSRYRDAALVFCETDKERRELDDNIHEAANSTVMQQIQTLLETRHANTQHYVDEWWTKYAYLEDRDPIVPQESAVFEFASGTMGGEFPVPQCVRAALIAHSSSLIHQSLCDESFPVVGPSTTKPFAMDQFRHIYETCRIPQHGFDSQRYFFETNTERQVSRLPQRRTIILGSRGRFYEIALDSTLTNKPLSVGALWAKIVHAQHHSETHPVAADEVTHVGFFTGAGRDEWASFREALIKANPMQNVNVLDAIERATMIISLLDSPCTNENFLSEVSMSRDAGSRWYDKSTQFAVYKNGTAGCSMEHSVMDAAGQFMLHAQMERMMTEWFASTSSSSSYETRLRTEAMAAKLEAAEMPKFLRFVTSSSSSSPLQVRVNRFRDEYLARRSKVWQIQTSRFQGVGKRILKGLGVSPDSFLQVALQTTYYGIHRRIPSTYETVGMLPFRLGRTEAGRSATMASRELCEALYNAPTNGTSPTKEALSTMIVKACEAHSSYIRMAAQGGGIDRHIFAIKCQCRESGLPVPKVFDNDVYRRASKWDMSTSHAYVDVLHYEKGGTSFRPFDPDMTGVVYGIFDEWVDVTVITCTPPKYDTSQFLTHLGTEIPKLYRILHHGGRRQGGNKL